MKHRSFVLAAFVVLSTLSSCGDPPATKEIIPRVRVFTVGKKSTGQSRSISGKVQAATESALSFGVGGKVVEIVVSDGSDVAKGQLLARLDDEPARIKLRDARAKLNSSRAKLREAESTLVRTEKLFNRDGASRKALTAATSNLADADSKLKSAQGNLSQAELDYAHTKLTAPFGGKIEKVLVDPFQQVGGNETILTLQSLDFLEIKVRVPETLIRHVDHGQAVQATFPSSPDASVLGVITTIAAEAEEGNAFPVTIRLSESEADLRPGMTASVMFNFDSYLEGRTAYLIPLSAIAIDAGLRKPRTYVHDTAARKNEAPVFVLDPQAGKVLERKVVVGGLRGNELEVFSGLEPGDLVVTAGVTYLRDGMKAKAWTPSSRVSDKRTTK